MSAELARRVFEIIADAELDLIEAAQRRKREEGQQAEQQQGAAPAAKGTRRTK